MYNLVLLADPALRASIVSKISKRRAAIRTVQAQAIKLAIVGFIDPVPLRHLMALVHGQASKVGAYAKTGLQSIAGLKNAPWIPEASRPLWARIGMTGQYGCSTVQRIHLSELALMAWLTLLGYHTMKADFTGRPRCV